MALGLVPMSWWGTLSVLVHVKHNLNQKSRWLINQYLKFTINFWRFAPNFLDKPAWHTQQRPCEKALRCPPGGWVKSGRFHRLKWAMDGIVMGLQYVTMGLSWVWMGLWSFFWDLELLKIKPLMVWFLNYSSFTVHPGLGPVAPTWHHLSKTSCTNILTRATRF